MLQIRTLILLCITLITVTYVTDSSSWAATKTHQKSTIDRRGTPGTRNKQLAIKNGIPSAPAINPLPSTRIALVIGNAAYTAPGLELINPINDAQDMATTLEGLGFAVRRVENADLTMMQDAIKSFNRELTNNSGVGLFYFAGHGVKSESGLNYLIPVDFKMEYAENIAKYSVDADSIRESMENSHSALNIAILDACRNSLTTRGLKRIIKPGLAEIKAKGSIVAMSTCPGCVALDGKGKNGLYTSHLLKYMRTPGMEIEDMFKNVRRDVATETDNRQKPWFNSSVQGDFTFVPVGTEAPPPALTIAPPSQPERGHDTARTITVDFAMFKDTGTTESVRLQNGDTLQSGDGYFFHIQTGAGKQNYLYVYDIDSSGKMFRLFPNSAYHTASNPIPANTRVTLPNEQEVYFLDNTVGKENFYFLASSSPVPALEKLENGTVDDIMKSGFPLRGTAGVKNKKATVMTHVGETQAQTQELKFSKNLAHTITINHQ